MDMVVAGRALGKPPPSPTTTLRVTATLRGVVKRAMVRQRSSFSIAAIEEASGSSASVAASFLPWPTPIVAWAMDNELHCPRGLDGVIDF